MSTAAAHAPSFRTHWSKRKPAFWLSRFPRRPVPRNTSPLTVRLDPLPGHLPNGKPTVRIFVGTEPRQYRAERVLVWSIMKVRDPARAYEIRLLKDLEGIDRTGWTTGFTNYRYAIPALAGGTGRAIYNDVDQLYLADPAEMFDIDMKDAGVASITERENSVMVIDCARMAGVWPLDRIKASRGHSDLRNEAVERGLWTELPAGWNVRDGELPLDQTKLIHYTTLHTQPWKPFPEIYSYEESPVGPVFHGLEAEANAAGFLLFTKEYPSPRYGELLQQYQQMHGYEGSKDAEADAYFDGRSVQRSYAPIARLVAETGAATILDYGAGKGRFYAAYESEPLTSRHRSLPEWKGVKVICYDPGYAPFAEPFDGQADGVISTDVVEHIPVDDVPWIVDAIFSKARKFVYVVAASYPARKTLPNGENAHCTILPPVWWQSLFDSVSAKYPEILFVLACEEKGLRGMNRSYFRGQAGRSAPL